MKDLKGKEFLENTINKYIYKIIPRDSRGRGGRYKELNDSKWYTYQIDQGGTLTFLDTINNLKLKPTNFILEIPKSIYDDLMETFRIYSDGETPKTYVWKKDGVTIAASTKEELIIEKVTEANAGKYEVIISNPNGSIIAHTVDLNVVCDPFQASNINLDTDIFIVSSALQNN